MTRLTFFHKSLEKLNENLNYFQDLDIYNTRVTHNEKNNSF